MVRVIENDRFRVHEVGMKLGAVSMGQEKVRARVGHFLRRRVGGISRVENFARGNPPIRVAFGVDVVTFVREDRVGDSAAEHRGD